MNIVPAPAAKKTKNTPLFARCLAGVSATAMLGAGLTAAIPAASAHMAQNGGYGAKPTPAVVAVNDKVELTYCDHLSGDIKVLGNDKNTTGVTVKIVQAPKHGTAKVLPNGEIKYDRKKASVGDDVFKYSATDAAGRTSVATVAVIMKGDPKCAATGGDNTAVKRIQAMNDRVEMTYSKHEKGDIPVLGNDKNATGATVTIKTAPKIGTATVLDNGRVRYDRTDKGAGNDVFKYAAKDKNGHISVATVRIIMKGTAPKPGNNNGGNNNPSTKLVANSDTIHMTYSKHEKGDVPVLANDKFTGKVTVTVTKAPKIGTATVLDNGRIRYNREGKGAGNDILMYTIKDANGKTSSATLKVVMRGTPTKPGYPKPGNNNGGDNTAAKLVALNDKIHMKYGGREKGDVPVLNNDKFTGKVTVTITKAPKIGTATVLDNGRIRYDRKGKGAGNDILTYTIKDANGKTASAKLQVIMRGTPSKPGNNNGGNNGGNNKPAPKVGVQANDDKVGMTYCVHEDGIINVLDNDKNTTGAKVTITKAPTVGTATVTADNQINYTRVGKKGGNDLLEYTATSPNGVKSVATLRIVMKGNPYCG